MKRYLKFFFSLATIFILFSISIAAEEVDRVYPVVSCVNVHQSPKPKAKVITQLSYGQWVTVKAQQPGWYHIRTVNGQEGYIPRNQVAAAWIKILKDQRQLILMNGNKEVRTFPMALGFNPKDDKIKKGDGCTPEGRFYICEVIRNPQPRQTYGPVSLRISYPNIEDARRGLRDKLITQPQYRDIIQAVHQVKLPPQNTPLGGSIKIHGGAAGVESDWTLGCVALNDSDMSYVFTQIPQSNALVEIYRNRTQERLLNDTHYVNREILRTSHNMIKKGCTYTQDARAIIPLSYPYGDFNPRAGVCTDVVIRALRRLNIDLQALVYEDILLNPRRYPGIKSANANIDHRRTRNLKIYLDHHALKLTLEPPAKNPQQWLPGDIVLMDTGIDNGTIYDHIGIVSDRKTDQGIPLVINLWTTGCHLNEMDLLQGDYPGIVGHYRLFHPYYYNAVR